MHIKVSPINLRKKRMSRYSSPGRHAYMRMHSQAFPNRGSSLNRYRAMHSQAFPNRSSSLNRYRAMHAQAFPNRSSSLNRYRAMHSQAFPTTPRGPEGQGAPEVQDVLDVQEELNQCKSKFINIQ
jgi:hypothetical protein